MDRTLGNILLSACVLFSSARVGFAQVPDPLPPFEPLPVAPAPVSVSEGRCCVSHRFAPSLEDRNGALLFGNPILDCGPDSLGWFCTAELDYLHARVANGLRGSVTAGGTTNQLNLPSAGLDWVLSPRIDLGYRMGQGAGEFLVSYRFFSTAGSDTTPDFTVPGNTGFLHSQLNMHIIDLDYACKENSLLPSCDMKARVGVRLTSLFFESQEVSPVVQQRVANSFFGAGPHVALDLWRPVIDSRVGLFCKLDVAGVLGQVRQSFEETIATANGPVSGYTPQSQFVPTVSLMVQAGVACTPRENWRVSLGYSYEHWWDVGFAGAIFQPPSFSRAEIEIQGIFLRSEWKF